MPLSNSCPSSLPISHLWENIGITEFLKLQHVLYVFWMDRSRKFIDWLIECKQSLYHILRKYLSSVPSCILCSTKLSALHLLFAFQQFPSSLQSSACTGLSSYKCALCHFSLFYAAPDNKYNWLKWGVFFLSRWVSMQLSHNMVACSAVGWLNK